MGKPRKSSGSRKSQRGKHTIPHRVSVKAINQSTVRRSQHEERAIREYIEWQSPREKVTHLEKVHTESVYERRVDAWDVWTTRGRYWVITNPTNLYSQALFPSLDYTISFHLGLTMRVMASEERNPSNPQKARLAKVWRKLTRASESLDRADEAEDFQSVGMRCRECLISLVRAIANGSMVPAGHETPKAADFVQWAQLIADAIASGSSATEIRGYLKTVSKSTWQFVNWLTHATNSVRVDAMMAVSSTENLTSAFGAALSRFESGGPDRCPNCGSYRLASVYQPELETDPPYVTLCESCGWSNHGLETTPGNGRIRNEGGRPNDS